MIVVEYRGYLIQSIPATSGSTVYRVRDIRDIWQPLFYSLAAAQRAIDVELDAPNHHPPSR